MLHGTFVGPSLLEPAKEEEGGRPKNSCRRLYEELWQLQVYVGMT